MTFRRHHVITHIPLSLFAHTRNAQQVSVDRSTINSHLSASSALHGATPFPCSRPVRSFGLLYRCLSISPCATTPHFRCFEHRDPTQINTILTTTEESRVAPYCDRTGRSHTNSYVAAHTRHAACCTVCSAFHVHDLDIRSTSSRPWLKVVETNGPAGQGALVG